MFTDGLHSRFSNAVIGRFKYLISSGIYWLWEKWDRIRFSQSGFKTGGWVTRRSKMASPKALAFGNSGTPWLFGTQILVWVTAMFVLAIETVNVKRISVAEWARMKKVRHLLCLRGIQHWCNVWPTVTSTRCFMYSSVLSVWVASSSPAKNNCYQQSTIRHRLYAFLQRGD